MNDQLGIYRPSYLRIKINRPVDFSSLKNLPDDIKATYFHEYTHFLQDVTTPSGINGMWNTYDRIRQVIAFVQKTVGDIQLPIKISDVEKESDHFKAMQEIRRSYGLKYPYTDDGSFVVTGLKLITKPAMEKVVPGYRIRFVELLLENKQDQKYAYNFGSDAITESMAYLLEKRFYKSEPAVSFPYCSAQLLADFVCKRIAQNEEFLYTVCDVSLLSTYPGWMFYLILLEIEQQNFIPKCSEELFDFGVKVMEERGWKIWDDFAKSREALNIIVNNLCGIKELGPTRLWLKTIVNAGYNLRLKCPYFMIGLYKDENTFGKCWEAVVATLGYPEMHDSENNRFFSPPLALKNLQNEIHPTFLLAFWQLHDLLLRNQLKCNLIDVCKQSKQKDYVNENCEKAPWLQADQELFCVFAALWVMFGFNKKKVIV